jgi:hypothetical protein
MSGRPCFRQSSRGTAFRPAYIDALLLLVALFIASSYWIVSHARRLIEPTSVTVICRAWEIEYYSFIAGLSRLRLMEAVVREHVGEGVVPFLFWSSLPHALCFRLFGPGGFLVTDLLGFVAFYLACVRMLCEAPVTELLAKTAAFLILGGVMPHLHGLLDSLPTAYRYHVSLEFWGLRIPQPFASSVPLCLCAAMFFRLLLRGSRDSRGWSWAGFGACLAILLQADPYQAGAVAISTPILVL